MGVRARGTSCHRQHGPLSGTLGGRLPGAASPHDSFRPRFPMPEGAAFLLFERAKFRTRLPRGRMYTAGHMWLQEAGEDLWRVGLTRFALRMLGEPVEIDFEIDVDGDVEKGQVLGWLEGFKAVTDLYSPMSGRFAGGNPELGDGLDAVHRSPYERGWLFALRGEPGEDCVDTEGYASFLEATIDKMLGEEKS